MDHEKRSGRRQLFTGIGLLAAFAVWTMLIQLVDVQGAGPDGTMIGFAVFNVWFHQLTGVHLTIYTITGVTDVLDGAIARKYGTTSEKGAKLDSIADLLFYTLILIRIFPVMWVTLPKKIWIMVGAKLQTYPDRGTPGVILSVVYHPPGGERHADTTVSNGQES